jgi:hypothetical protein
VDIKLNFINNSNDANDSEVVIFQKDVANDGDAPAIAWQVIRNCGKGDHHPFSYPLSYEIAAEDSYGNDSALLPAKPGDAFRMVLDNSGDVIEPAGAASVRTEVQLRNDLSRGAVTAMIYRSGKLLAIKPGLAPGETVEFQFKPTLWVGVVSQVEEGQVMDSAVVTDLQTQFSLEGIASADIVMTGGGPGPTATPFLFTLQNVVYA